MPKFNDIPPFTRNATWSCDVGWDYLPEFYLTHVEEYGLDVQPDFQRAHKWTQEQKTRYIEFVLRGGKTGRDIYTNNPDWQLTAGKGPYVLVDGKHRLDAVFAFLNNEIPAFGHLYREYEDPKRLRSQGGFRWHVNDLQTRDEVLQWYVDLNAGGTPHTGEEIDYVRALQGHGDFAPYDVEEVVRHARVDREIFQKLREKQEAGEVLRAKARAEEALKPKPVSRRRAR
jgi:hypothetical protein